MNWLRGDLICFHQHPNKGVKGHALMGYYDSVYFTQAEYQMHYVYPLNSYFIDGSPMDSQMEQGLKIYDMA